MARHGPLILTEYGKFLGHLVATQLVHVPSRHDITNKKQQKIYSAFFHLCIRLPVSYRIVNKYSTNQTSMYNITRQIQPETSEQCSIVTILR